MAFRSQKAISLILLLGGIGVGSAAEQLSFSVRHRHIRKGGGGELSVGDSSISFRESGKTEKHSRVWAYDDIQQLYVSPHSIRILTYEDVAWKFGQDRDFAFDQLPEGAAQQLLNAVRERIDKRRIVAALADPSNKPLWQVKAKLLEGLGGSEGIVLVGEDSIVYRSEERNASRTWHLGQIDNISSSGPFDLTITTFERDKSRYADRRDFRFQLKASLSEERYNALWRRLNESRISRASQNTVLKEKTNE